MLYKTCAKVFNRKRKADTGDCKPSEQPIFYKLLKKKNIKPAEFPDSKFYVNPTIGAKVIAEKIILCQHNVDFLPFWP